MYSSWDSAVLSQKVGICTSVHCKSDSHAATERARQDGPCLCGGVTQNLFQRAIVRGIITITDTFFQPIISTFTDERNK